MELDDMKGLWEKTNQIAERTKIREEKVIEMLKKSYKGAVNSLVNFELLMLISMPVCIGILYYMLYFITNSFPFGDSQAIKSLIWVLIGLCVFGLFWDWYKYNFLKKINIATMDILKVSKKILTYRKYIMKEFTIGMVFIIIFLPLAIYFGYIYRFGNEIIPSIIIFYAIIVILSILVTLYVYKKMYFSNIKKIQESLAEIEDFQHDIVE